MMRLICFKNNRERQPMQADLKPLIVWLILNGKPEEALTLLAKKYKVNVPKLKVGLPKGRKHNTHGCYTPKNETITVRDSQTLENPFVILHEFYHHLRTPLPEKKHKGTEKKANKFATDYIQEYKKAKLVHEPK